jgi:SOS response regulatory protein OraA/RecX
LVVNRFKAYRFVSDTEFSRYMCNERDDYTDGTAMTSQTLMTMALAKYHSLQEEGVWNAMSPEQEILVALSSAVSQLKDHNLKLTKSLKSGKKADIGKATIS